MWCVLGLTALARLAVFPWNENLYGDAAVRMELARAWLEHPHWMRAWNEGCWQFGPLHIYLVAAFLRLWPSMEHAGRLASLVCGIATVVPLFVFVRRRWSEDAALFTGLAFAVWGLHLQVSTTAGSEALTLFLLACLLPLYDEAHRTGAKWPLVGVGLLLNCVMATRYDAWLWPGLLVVGLLWPNRRRKEALLLGALSCPFPLLWLWGNATYAHDALAPMHQITEFHARWVKDSVSLWGEWGARFEGFFFWAGAALLSLTPLVALFSAIGLVRGVRRRPELWWLALLTLGPTAFFSVRALLLQFVPLARFTAAQLLLLLPWVHDGFEWAVARLSIPSRRPVLAVTAVSTLALPTVIAALTFRTEGREGAGLRPISPLSSNPPSLVAFARAAGEMAAGSTDTLFLDADPDFTDIQIAFFSRLPEDRWIRQRWPDAVTRRHERPPRYVIELEHGSLRRDVGVRRSEGWLELDGVRFGAIPLPGASRYRLYLRAASSE